MAGIYSLHFVEFLIQHIEFEVTKLCFDLSEEPCATLVALIYQYNIAWCPGSPGALVHPVPPTAGGGGGGGATGAVCPGPPV